METAKKLLIRYLVQENFDKAIEIKEEFLQDQEEFLNSEKVIDLAKEGFIKQLKKGYANDVIEVYKHFNLNKYFNYLENSAVEIFGNFLTFEIFEEIRSLDDSDTEIGKNLKELGLEKNKKPENILEDLKDILNKTKKDFMAEDFDLATLNKKIIKDFFKNFIRYEASSWGANR